MGFNTVYRALQELFPQVDVRILKAVAIEHAKDVDVAAETIVTEVLPFIPEKPYGQSFVGENDAHRSSVVDERHPVRSNDRKSSEHGSSCADEEAKGTNECGESQYAGSPLLNGTAHDSLNFDHPKDDDNQLVEHHVSKETSLSETFDTNALEQGHDKPFYDASDLPVNTKLDVGDTDVDLWKYHELEGFMNNYHELEGYMKIDTTVCASTSTSAVNDHVTGDDLSHGENENVGRDNLPLLYNFNQDISVCQQKLPTLDGDSEMQNILDPVYHLDGTLRDSHHLSQLLQLAVDDQRHEPLESLQSEHKSEKCASDVHTPDSRISVDACSKQDVQLPVDAEDSSLMNSIVSQSGQVCRIDLLENIIDEAKSHKERLSSAIESVTKLMWEVELAEKDAEKAKQDAARGGVDIYAGANELKTMLKHAKEANDMHSGEVYGERAILAAEVKELQNRLLSLSMERDDSLSMLDEMHKALEARKAAAEQEKIAAEEEKLQKETAARDVLAKQDIAMKRVVEESRVLDQEAEENEKLREFLVDRGHVVDSLQGEISVICQDVKLLKDKFDNRIPLSRSLSLSCALASSASSDKSSSSTDSVRSVNGQAESSEHPAFNVSAAQDAHSEKRLAVPVAEYKQLSDDDWEAI